MSDSTELERILEGTPREVAPRLLGWTVSSTRAGGVVSIRLTEVEAYGGADDPGSHAYRRRTARNATMFGPPGHLYVYFTYGMHFCANVVTGEPGEPGAVLLRAGEVVEGRDLARARRSRSSDRDLARGPARLCQALAIGRDDDGADLRGGEVRLRPQPGSPRPIDSGPRVGLRAAGDRPWRFWLDGEPTVSPYRPATPRPG